MATQYIGVDTGGTDVVVGLALVRGTAYSIQNVKGAEAHLSEGGETAEREVARQDISVRGSKSLSLSDVEVTGETSLTSTDISVAARGTVARSDIAVTAATRTLTTAGGSFAGFVVGEAVVVSGFTTAVMSVVVNNGTFTVESIAAGNKSMVLARPDGGVFVNEAAGNNVTIASRQTVMFTTAGDFSVFASYKVIRISGFTEAANNGTFTVESVSGGNKRMFLLKWDGPLLVDAGLVAEAAGDSIRIFTGGLVFVSLAGDFSAFAGTDVIEVSGFTDNNNNGTFMVVSVSGANKVLKLSRQRGAFASEDSGDTVLFSSTNKIVATVGGDFSAFNVGDTVTIAGFTDASNNGDFTVNSVAVGSKSMVLARPGGGLFVDEVAGDAVTVTIPETRPAVGHLLAHAEIYSETIPSAGKVWLWSDSRTVLAVTEEG